MKPGEPKNRPLLCEEHEHKRVFKKIYYPDGGIGVRAECAFCGMLLITVRGETYGAIPTKQSMAAK